MKKVLVKINGKNYGLPYYEHFGGFATLTVRVANKILKTRKWEYVSVEKFKKIFPDREFQNYTTAGSACFAVTEAEKATVYNS